MVTKRKFFLKIILYKSKEQNLTSIKSCRVGMKTCLSITQNIQNSSNE